MRSYFLTPVSLHCLWHRREERERRERQGGRKREGRQQAAERENNKERNLKNKQTGS
jgi:hypothetical protein